MFLLTVLIQLPGNHSSCERVVHLDKHNTATTCAPLHSGHTNRFHKLLKKAWNMLNNVFLKFTNDRVADKNQSRKTDFI